MAYSQTNLNNTVRRGPRSPWTLSSARSVFVINVDVCNQTCGCHYSARQGWTNSGWVEYWVSPYRTPAGYWQVTTCQ